MKLKLLLVRELKGGVSNELLTDHAQQPSHDDTSGQHRPSAEDILVAKRSDHTQVAVNSHLHRNITTNFNETFDKTKEISKNLKAIHKTRATHKE